MVFNPWTFLLEVINFLVLVAIVDRMVLRPIGRAIDERRAAIAAQRAEAERSAREATERARELEVRLAEIERERQTRLKEAQEQAADERQRLLEAAEREAGLRSQEQERELAARREEALAAIRTELLDLALGLAERLLREAAGTGLQDALADRLLDDLARIPEAERERLRRDWRAGTEAELEIPHEMDEQKLAQVEAAISALAGRRVPVNIRFEPALGCGIRLRMDGHLWDASLAGPLEELRRQAPLPEIQ